jgi:allantoin racemase
VRRSSCATGWSNNACWRSFGGGPIAGLARETRDMVPVPCLDGVSCAVRMAEALVALNPRPPSRGSFARPRGKPVQGLSPELMRRIVGDA